MALFRRQRDTGGYPKSDAGKGDLEDYKYDLVPKNKGVTIQLAGSDACQEELARVVATGAEKIDSFIAKRTIDEERTDAPMPVRLFVDSRMSGLVGYVPAGLEPAVIEAIVRLENAGRSTRIPAEIISVKGSLRVKLQMGATR
jgi:hypothetical protein